MERVPSQFTLGLFGPWGSGKSTILREVERRLNDGTDDRVLITFDAWRYDGDSFRREFVREVAEQLKAREVLPKRYDVKKEIAAFEHDVTRPREVRPQLSWAALLSAVFAAAVVLVVVAVVYGIVLLFDPSDQTELRAKLALLAPGVAFVLVVAGRLIAPVQVQESRRRFEFPEQFAATFRKLLEKVRVRQVVIAIDNLDRCSPQRVAEVLATIKTFLEPALPGAEGSGATRLSFVIAADDEALRRHLIAEEMAASAIELPGGATEAEQEGSGSVPGQAQAAMRVAREAVDEYLRKFFNAGIRITEMLDEDTRAFSEHELKDFMASHAEIDEETAARLIDLTALGLKRNPRRIKQFVNNLELRLQLFSDRRAAGHILIAPDVVMVAKLAILEEKFPDAYRELLKRPALLEQWHERAEFSDEAELDPDLVSFLRLTNNIRTPHIAAYLTLKQTAYELELPGYEEFTSMLEEARTSPLAEIVASMSPEEVGRHAEAARHFFDRQLAMRSWAGAHNTARSVLETASLQSENGGIRTYLLDRELTHPELKKRLVELDPQLLLNEGRRHLVERRFVDLVGALISSAAAPQASKERVDLICKSFEDHADWLGIEARNRLACVFEKPPLSERFASYAGLAEAVPGIVSPFALEQAIEELEGVVDFELDDPRFRVAMAPSTIFTREEALAERLLIVVGAALRHRRSQGGPDFVELAEKMRRLVAASRESDAMAYFASEIEETWAQLLPGGQWPSLDLALELCGVSSKADSEHGGALGARVFDAAESQHTPYWVDANEVMPPGFQAGFFEALTAGVAGERGDLDPYLRVAAALEEERRHAVVVGAAHRAAEGGRYGVVETLVPELDSADVAGVVDEVAGRAEAEVAIFVEGAMEGLEFLLEHQRRLSPKRLDGIVRMLVELLIERRELAPALGPLIGGFKLKEPDSRCAKVERLIDFADELTDRERRIGVLRGAYGLAGRSDKALKLIRKEVKRIRKSDPEMADRIAAMG